MVEFNREYETEGGEPLFVHAGKTSAWPRPDIYARFVYNNEVTRVDLQARGLKKQNEILSQENQEQSEEINYLVDKVSKFQTWLRRKIPQYRRLRKDLAATKTELASVEAELADLKGSIAEIALKRMQFQPFWALGTAEARLLLVTAHCNGPIGLGEIVEHAQQKTEILEGMCRLHTVGLIKFENSKVCITVTGQEFVKRLGFAY
jgi:hypothetical protein